MEDAGTGLPGAARAALAVAVVLAIPGCFSDEDPGDGGGSGDGSGDDATGADAGDGTSQGDSADTGLDATADDGMDTSGSSGGECSDTMLDCNGASADGCETDILSDPNNCGDCGNGCSAPANGLAVCESGGCAAVCDEGFGDCNDSLSDGCETDVHGSLQHCGRCDNPCPDGLCVGGACEATRRVFATSQSYDGNLGGLDGADGKCQSAADAAGLGGAFKAWLSDLDGNAAGRLVHSNAPYALVDGRSVATGWNDLIDGLIANPINVDEHGNAAPMVMPCDGGGVWTGTSSVGTPTGGSWCDSWTTADPSLTALSGNRTQTNTEWSFDNTCGPVSCDRRMPLYCFEQ